jgi:thiol:disulfide interchange protein DsbC
MTKMIMAAPLMVLAAAPAWGCMEGGCGAGKCTDCHSLTRDEAGALLPDGVDRVLNVDQAELPDRRH